MLETLVGSVFVDALVLSGLLYLLARHEADLDFQKLAMVVAGTALGNVGLSVAVGQTPPALQVWLLPVLQIAFAAFMVMTFCWISFAKSLLVVVIFSALHFGSGLAMKWLVGKFMAGSEQTVSMQEKHEAELAEAKAEMERMWKQQYGPRGAPSPETSAAPEVANASLPAAPADAPAPVETDAGLFGAAPPAKAQAVAPPAAAPSPAADTGATGSDLFAVPGPGPGGTVPAGPADDPARGWDEARKNLKINGITKQGQTFTALINQRVVRAGDTVSVTSHGRTYRWIVREITRGDVRFEPRDVGTAPAGR